VIRYSLVNKGDGRVKTADDHSEVADLSYRVACQSHLLQVSQLAQAEKLATHRNLGYKL